MDWRDWASSSSLVTNVMQRSEGEGEIAGKVP